MSHDEVARVNLYAKATALLERDRIIFRTPPMRLNWSARRRTRKAVRLLEQFVGHEPQNWAALWIMGKANQGLERPLEALDCFERAWRWNPEHPDVAREAGISAMECQRFDLAIKYTSAAIRLKPSDAGLYANLGLAFLFNQQPDEARRVIDESMTLSPGDAITQRISHLIDDVRSGRRACPRKVAEI